MTEPTDPARQPPGDDDRIDSAEKTVFVDAPTELGPYRLTRILGRGGMGEVWQALDTNLERDVAVKLMRKELLANEEAIRRFAREARAVARLNHPNIVQVYAFGDEKGVLYFVMELVEGETVTQLVKRDGVLGLDAGIRVMLQAVEGLAYAAARGIVHRDIKPSNLMITPDGRVKIADFGLAKIIESQDSMVTAAGSTMGSPNYMSPEQARGEEADHRSDMYSLGISFYQMLTNQLPFTAQTPLSVLLKQIQEPMPEPDFLKGLADGRVMNVIRRMTEKSANARYQTYAELSVEIAALAPGAATSGVAGVFAGLPAGLAPSAHAPTGSLPMPVDPPLGGGGGITVADGIPSAIPSGPPTFAARPAVTPNPDYIPPAGGVMTPRAEIETFSSPPPVPPPIPVHHAADAMATPVARPARRSSKGLWIGMSMLGLALLAGGGYGAYVWYLSNFGPDTDIEAGLRPPGSSGGERTPVPPLASSNPAPAPTPTPAPRPSATPFAIAAATPVPTPPLAAPGGYMVVPVMPGMFPLPGYVAPTTPGGPGPGMPPPNATPEPPPTPVPTVTPGSVSYGIVGSKLDANDLVDATDESGRAVLTRIPARARVEVLRASRIGDRSVHLVRYGKVIGYVLSDQLELRLSGEPEPVTPTPAAGATPARGLPSLVTIAAGNARVKIYNNAEMGREITTVAPGTKATVLDAEGATYKVRLPDGGTGFVLKKLTDFP